MHCNQSECQSENEMMRKKSNYEIVEAKRTETEEKKGKNDEKLKKKQNYISGAKKRKEKTTTNFDKKQENKG